MMLKRGVLLMLALLLMLLPLTVQKADARQSPSSLMESFRQASETYKVPLPLLMAIGYAETRWNHHDGQPSQLNGYGIMHLVDNPRHHTLQQAAQLTRFSEERLKQDSHANIMGAAAVLAHIAKEQGEGRLPDRLGKWYPVAAEYAGYQSQMITRLHVDEVFRLIREGVSKQAEGERLELKATRVLPDRGIYEHVQLSNTLPAYDYPNARWIPADSSNYNAANREGDGNDIDKVVIHTTQGSYAGAISWFQNPSSNVSAHYVIRSSDGEITQMVQDSDIAWHAGNWDYNVHSIGIEHEGYVEEPGWYTDSMYRSSAALTRWLCDQYEIPRDRSHIIGHSEVPGATHTDPGSQWDWNYYMSLVNQ
ncbi:MAG: N-acetylmuramoyl-L-alanine amidase [Firmicutes bacterium]|uniref:N-acetylmuramoyl-L-alanine amidase n=1 Tax=Melghirimyces thermohalophilus TaxID=1236220 RepID=A0A1G6HSW4_9BACL|nr:N-acetylmuramoyl-L-alanine amidase [Melghirimyces thermohalophilus]MDA8354483.1 N-acetylmuramoyl-L-alanine amidase [Bacillota bacterium]SDB97243.1 N-acetylmuramoyl-L-alanine amidase [Melghirimyces thermohalophilus]